MPDYLSRSPVGPAEDDPDDNTHPHVTDIATQTEPCIDLEPSISSTINMVTTRSRARKVSHNDIPTPSISTSAESITSPSPCTSTIPQSVVTDPRITFGGDLTELQEAQRLDPDIQHIINNIHHSRYMNSYLLVDGLLMHRDHNSKPVPCVPPGHFRTDIMKIYHDTPANGAHFGRDKTIQKIRARYYWNNMISDISNYIQSCLRCNQNNPIRRKPPGHLKPIEPPEGVWQLLAMDFHGPITPTSRSGNKYIISLTDILSKFVITKAVRDCTTDTAARFLQEDVICKYGTPKCILTDNGTHFTSTMMKTLLQRLGITHLYSTPYHPQTNGQIERFNSTMDAKIASLSNQSRSDWDDQLPFVTFNYNATVHSTTKTIPFELMYGRSPVFPFDPQHQLVSLPHDPHYSKKLSEYISNLTDITKRNITITQQRYKS
jgi:transposase InsO family protein